MDFEIVHVSRGDIRLKSEDRLVRVLGEALIATESAQPSYVIYLNSVRDWEVPPNVALTDAEKTDVINAIKKHFQDRNSLVDFE